MLFLFSSSSFSRGLIREGFIADFHAGQVDHGVNAGKKALSYIGFAANSTGLSCRTSVRIFSQCHVRGADLLAIEAELQAV